MYLDGCCKKSVVGHIFERVSTMLLILPCSRFGINSQSDVLSKWHFYFVLCFSNVGTLSMCLVWEPNGMGWVHPTFLG